MKKIIVFTTVLISFSLKIFAQNQDWHKPSPKRDLINGTKAYKKHLYRDAYFLLDGIKDDKVFNIEAEMMMGVLCDYGYETMVNPPRAAQYYKDVAAAGFAEAQNNLGNLYFSGRGVEQSYTEAAKLFQQAADQKFTNAQYSLGSMYFWGQGVEKNYENALKYFTLAADGGSEIALYCEGYMYENGLGGVGKDIDKAIKLFTKAANKGELNAQNKLGEMYEKGIGENQDFAIALSWYQKAADKSFGPAQFNIARLYEYGIGVKLNHYEAYDWFKKASYNGNIPAILIYANYWATGQGYVGNGNVVDDGHITNNAVAVTWYLKAAATGNEEAVAALQKLGYSAKGETLIKRNITEEIAAGSVAYTLGQNSTYFRILYSYRLSPEFSKNDILQLAGLYERGQGCDKNGYLARDWYIKSANLGSDVALYKVAHMYEEGENGLAINQTEAMRLYKMAADRGNTAAINKLNPPTYNNSNNSSQPSRQSETKPIAYKSTCPICNGSGFYGQGYYVSRNGTNVYERPRCITCGGTGYVMKY